MQVKFRGNTENYLTANNDHISNFVAHSFTKHQVPNSSNNMLIITTAKDLHPVISEQMYNAKVRVINYHKMQTLLDDCTLFWDNFYEALLLAEGNLVVKEPQAIHPIGSIEETGAAIFERLKNEKQPA